jgi:hypothetical protein
MTNPSPSGRRRSPRRPCSAPIARSAFAGFRFPPDIIVLAVRWYLRFGLSYRDVEELLAERAVEVDHVNPTCGPLPCDALKRLVHRQSGLTTWDDREPCYGTMPASAAAASSRRVRTSPASGMRKVSQIDRASCQAVPAS